MPKVSVIVFPGSNCDRDIFHVFDHIFQFDTSYHWYDEPISRSNCDLAVIPGGFSYGDYLRAGFLATLSDAVLSLDSFVENGGKVLGICNGFQVLTERKLLPGVLTKNNHNRFVHRDVNLRLENSETMFTCNGETNQVLRMPVAHAEGRYLVSEDELHEMEKKNQIVFRYCSSSGDVGSEDENPNGSLSSIAGVVDSSANVMGMMPHPERSCESILGGVDGKFIFESIYKYFE